MISQAVSLEKPNVAGSRATESSAPAYDDKFSHKIKIQSKNDLDSDLVSDEEGQEDAWLINTGKHTIWFPSIGQEISHSC
jgi:hypothetical protein